MSKKGSYIIILMCFIAIGMRLRRVDAGPGIPIHFNLKKPGYVTLVIEDKTGRRVRNLIADTFFEAGTHTVWWDGLDAGDFLPIPKEHGSHKYYDILQEQVPPGTYYVRGIVHEDIELKYEFSVQSPGNPPWKTSDRTGNWLADHTPPVEALFLPDGSPHGEKPQVMISAPTGEAGYSTMWLTLDGEKLYGAKMRGWRSALAAARDDGPGANTDYYAYGLVEGRLYGFKANVTDAEGGSQYREIVEIKTPEAVRHDDWNWLRKDMTYGMAARNGFVLISYPCRDAVIFFNTRKTGEDAQIGTAEVADPRGMTFDSKGNLYLICGTAVKRYEQVSAAQAKLGPGKEIIRGLEDPNRLVLGPEGNFYVSDTGESHQVKVFTPAGKPIRTIGDPGGPQLGHYNERRMSNPAGMAIDSDGKLWVTEAEYMPKRISVWNARSGDFIRAYYGPPKYGGGGRLDPGDRTKFYYGVGTGTIEFTLDWEKGTAKPTKICYRRGAMVNNMGGGGPQKVVYGEDGRRYFAGGGNLYVMGAKGVLKLIAYNGMAGKHHKQLGQFINDHPSLEIKNNRGRPINKKFVFISWSDLNGDQHFQMEEVKTTRSPQAWMGVRYQPDLSIRTSRGISVGPPSFSDGGVPVWDLETLRQDIDFADLPSMNDPKHYKDNYRGSYAFLPEDGYQVMTRGPIYGWKDGRFVWVYHSQWPMRGTGFDPVPQYPGHLIATAGVIGTFTPPSGELGAAWILNNDRGSIYVLSSDGLFLTDLGGDARTHRQLGPPEAERGMVIDDYSFGTELFGPAATQIKGKKTYLTAGHPSTNIFEITGLDTVRRLPRRSVEVEPGLLADCPEARLLPADRREHKTATVIVCNEAPEVDGKLGDWQDASWVKVDDRLNIRGAMAVCGDTLYVAWDIGTPDLLKNDAADGWKYLFATGGGLDLMLRTRPDSEDRPRRRKYHSYSETAARGDLRLFITRVGDPESGPVRAVRFQQVGGEGDSMTYVSPVGQVDFDAVKDVSHRVKLAQKAGQFEVAVPLSVLNFSVRPGLETLGDIGVLTGDGDQTTNRLYWNNKASNMVSDIPTEARLTPEEWGTLRFTKADNLDARRRGVSLGGVFFDERKSSLSGGKEISLVDLDAEAFSGDRAAAVSGRVLVRPRSAPFLITENPEENEYRYFQMAWKPQTPGKIHLEVRVEDTQVVRADTEVEMAKQTKPGGQDEDITGDLMGELEERKGEKDGGQKDSRGWQVEKIDLWNVWKRPRRVTSIWIYVKGGRVLIDDVRLRRNLNSK